MGISTVTGLTAITVIVYIIASIIKATVNNEKIITFIPSLCGIIGGIISLICHFTSAGLLPVDNWLSAFSTGALCGLSATGINQITKQLSNNTTISTNPNHGGDDPDA